MWVRYERIHDGVTKRRTLGQQLPVVANSWREGALLFKVWVAVERGVQRDVVKSLLGCDRLATAGRIESRLAAPCCFERSVASKKVLSGGVGVDPE